MKGFGENQDELKFSNFECQRKRCLEEDSEMKFECQMFISDQSLRKEGRGRKGGGRDLLSKEEGLGEAGYV